MNQFFLQQGCSPELLPFPYIVEFALKKNHSIQLNSFSVSTSNLIRFYMVLDGKFQWFIQQEQYQFYPTDFAVVLPGQAFGSEQGILDIGTICWLHLKADFNSEGWSGIPPNEQSTIHKILKLNETPVISKFREMAALLQNMRTELVNQQIGFTTKIHQLTDELFILLARQLSHQNNPQRDFPQAFLNLDRALRQNLAHQWTVEEMAALMGLGITAFTEKVKNYTGFSPLNYLINIRISEAIRLLKRKADNVTHIALETGFYSSQHFSTTFKKLTGYTPSHFRKIHNNQNGQS